MEALETKVIGNDNKTRKLGYHMPSKGVLYIASTTGQNKYLEEALLSARSVKEQTDLPVTLVANKNPKSPYIDRFMPLQSPDHSFRDKIKPLRQTPYEQTLFLDTDTYVTTDITHIFDLLETFELGVAHAPYRELRSVGVPKAFPELNTGVILYESNSTVLNLFKNWLQLHDKYDPNRDGANDQPPFREALYNSDVSFTILPSEYNCRFIYPGYLSGEVKILHGRHPNMEEMAKALNEETDRRVFTGDAHRRIYAYPMPVKKLRYPGPNRYRHMVGRIIHHLQEDGWKKTGREILNRLLER